MLYYFLYPLSADYIIFNLFKYITFRTFGALFTSLLIYLLLGKHFIRFLNKKRVGQFIRSEGPQSHFGKKGTPTMGGILILFSFAVSILLWGNWENAYLWLTSFILFSFAGIGFYDDFKKQIRRENLGLKGKYKLSLQILISLTAGVFLLKYLDFSTVLIFPFFKQLQPDLGW
jgi:phospho-N-acetylmuramoyl-pentapeptide-transferase